MRVAIVGAGVAGVALAHELVLAGHDVSVFERGASTAAGGSYAHAGVIEPAFAMPWLFADDSGKAPRTWFGQTPALRLNSKLDMASRSWWNGVSRAATSHRDALIRLAAAGYARFDSLHHAAALECEMSNGVLVPWRTEADAARFARTVDAIKAAGANVVAVDAEAAHRIEPWLGQEATVHSALHFPSALVGNCRQFTNLLRAESQRRGVRYRFHAKVHRLVPGAQPEIEYVREEKDIKDPKAAPRNSSRESILPTEGPDTEPMPPGPAIERFDAVVLCNALDANALLSPHRVRLPLTPVYGLSVTAPLRLDDRFPDRGPRAGLVDVVNNVTISHLGTRVRVSGLMDIGGGATEATPADLEPLYRVLHEWFPGVANLSHVLPWRGARTFAPDGKPLIGATGLPNVWLVAGLGEQGWPLACAAAQGLADQLSTRPSPIDLAAFAPTRPF